MKTFVGLGYIIYDKEYQKFKSKSEEFADWSTQIASTPAKYFFGEVLCELEPGAAHPIDALTQLPGFDFSDFGLNLGGILYECGVTPDEIEERWNYPSFYFINSEL